MSESGSLLVAQRRDAHRLLQASGLLFLLGLVVGLGVPRFTVPRLALSAHLLGITQGTFLMVGGLLWPKLRLNRAASGIGRVLATYGCLAAWTASLLGALWGAGASMVPMAAGAARGSAVQEATIRLLLISAALSLVCVAVLILWGLRTLPHTARHGMENWARVLLLIVLLPLGRLVHAAEQEAASGVDRQAAVDTVLGVFRAAELKQVDRVEAYHWFGPEFTKFDEFGLGREDAATARAGERRDLASVKTFKAAVQDLKVDLVAGATVATFILAYSADTAEGAVEAKLRSTVVLAKREGSWKIVHEHYSRLVGNP